MRKDCLWRHRLNTTVALEVITRFYVKEKGEWSLKVSWWRVSSFGAPYPIGISQRIRIPDSALPDWTAMGFDDHGPIPAHKEM